MISFLWFLAAAAIYLFIGTVGCGGLVCLPVIAILYAPFTWSVLLYLAIGEAASSRLFPRSWSIGGFLAIAACGLAVLILILKTREPLLFTDSERSMAALGLILYPSIGAAILYAVKCVLAVAVPGQTSTTQS